MEMASSPLALRIATDIATKIGAGELDAGSHLATEALAREFRVSRSPVREALGILSERGLIENRRNRGFFVRDDALSRAPSAPDEPGSREDSAYFRFAEDWLNDRIASEITEQFVRDRYGLTRTQAGSVLLRAARDGWAEPKPGYGWTLRAVAKTSEAFEQIYRFRAVIEPAAMLEPTFRFDRATAAKLRRAQEKLASGDIGAMPAEALTQAGAVFHQDVIRMANNPMFVQALERANQLRRLIEHRLKVDPARIVAQSAEHLQILDLLEGGDNLGAAHLMRRHLNGALAVKSPKVRPLRQAAE
jgi:DNA-binding GntR family transcriptional regulator